MLEKIQWTKKDILLTIDGVEELIHKEAYLEANLDEGDEVDLETLRHRSDFFFGLERAKFYLSRGPKTRWQLRAYLVDRGFSSPVEEILDLLTEYGLLNDLDYAQRFYEEERHKRGSMAIAARLRERGVCSRIIDQLSMEEDPEDAALILRKKYSDWEELDGQEEAKRKNFLLGRGFSYETINKSIFLAKNWKK